ncbi:T9SS type A sorting domain-containing protein [Hymenobacter bucti]|uniref:T9SS type A sorting domain-containing protein n=1 Tax=Hymenobacter bucti TaxID=1844114 RepID=A0ABW4R257_9BACT
MEQTYSPWLTRRLARPPAALGLLLATAGIAHAQTPAATFAPAATYGTGGSNPQSIAVADVNGDGKPDLLTANFSSNTAGVLLNTTVYAPTLTTISPNPAAVGTSVTLTGTNLTGATGVSFNGTAAPGFVVNAAGTSITVSVPTGATTGNIAVTTPGGTSNGVAFTVITATTWTGVISTAWFTAANWSAGVPTATIDAIIPAGAPFAPLITAGTAEAQNLTLSTGATLSQSGGTLRLTGNLTNNGTLAATGGTVATNGSALQTLGGSSPLPFWNLTIGAASASLGTSASFQRVLTLTGNLTTNGQSLTLLSRVSGGAALDGLVVNNGGVVMGTATVQRAIDPSVNPGPGYRHYSAPVSNTTVADLTTPGFMPVVSPAYNTSATPTLVQPFPTVFGYDDSRLNLANNLPLFDKGYFSPAALSDPLAVGRGYSVNIAASEVVDFQGTLNNGTLTLPLTSTRNTYPDGGWQLLGNPYPAPLDYSRVTPVDRLGLESAIYVYSSTSQYQGRYRAYINGIGNPVLPVGQGFFARVTIGQTSATMTFRNSQRLTVPNGTSFQRTAADARPLVALTLQGAGNPLLDEATVYFESGATSGFEPAFDAEKLPNPTGLNLATSLANGRQLSIDGQPELGSSQCVVPLAVGVPAPGIYTFTASQLLNLSTVPVYLRDGQLGTLTDLRQQPTYQFTVSSATALNTTRFALVFSPQQPLATVPADLAQQVALYPNPAKANTQLTLVLPAALGRQPVTAALLDALGRVVHQQVLPAGLASHTLPLNDLVSGVYSLRLTTPAGVVVKKLVIE